MEWKWVHCVGQAWALGTLLAIFRASRHSQRRHPDSLVHPLLAFADATKLRWRPGLLQSPTKASHVEGASHPGLPLCLPAAGADGMAGEARGPLTAAPSWSRPGHSPSGEAAG